MMFQFENQWSTPNLTIIDISFHNCGLCRGVDLYLLGFGVVFRI
jgi:hypothetical protein